MFFAKIFDFVELDKPSDFRPISPFYSGFHRSHPYSRFDDDQLIGELVVHRKYWLRIVQRVWEPCGCFSVVESLIHIYKYGWSDAVVLVFFFPFLTDEPYPSYVAGHHFAILLLQKYLSAIKTFIVWGSCVYNSN